VVLDVSPGRFQRGVHGLAAGLVRDELEAVALGPAQLVGRVGVPLARLLHLFHELFVLLLQFALQNVFACLAYAPKASLAPLRTISFRVAHSAVAVAALRHARAQLRPADAVRAVAKDVEEPLVGVLAAVLLALLLQHANADGFEPLDAMC